MSNDDIINIISIEERKVVMCVQHIISINEEKRKTVLLFSENDDEINDNILTEGKWYY